MPEVAAAIRLQEYGVGIFAAASTKSSLKKALKKGYVTVDGKSATTATFIKGGETIILNIPAETNTPTRLHFPLKVLYEDEHMAVIHKPAGILVSGNAFKTISNALPQNIKQSSLPDATTPQPIHRLDYGTTGILLAGKTHHSIRTLNKKFENKEVIKSYYAVAIGKMNPKGSITEKIDSKGSRTDYRVCASVRSEKYGTLSLVKLFPQTGRRHQIRKHLSCMGNPVLGDQEYGQEGLILKGKGIYLHAYSLAFSHPFSSERMYFTDPLPEKFRNLFTNLKD
mgnify:CR=1 FL=1